MQRPDTRHIKTISAIVLAAGESKRMGRVKQLLPFGDTTVLAVVMDSLARSTVNETILVLGSREEEIRSSLPVLPAKTIVNRSYREGMGSSIVSGMRAVSDDTDAVMIVLADQPLIDATIIDRLVEACRGSDRGIIVPCYGQKRGNPVIFDMKYRERLSALQGDRGGRDIVRENSDDVLEVDIESEAVISDIDEEDEYRRQLEKFDS